MTTTRESVHVSVRIDRSARDVYDYAASPEHMGEWAKGLSSGLVRSGDVWVGDGAIGRVTVRFTERNTFGVLDHHVTTPDGTVNDNPMRVVANGGGSELVFTVFRRPGVSSEEFQRDVAAVQRDLETLKRIVEALPRAA